MSATVMISGALFKAPQQKISKSGKNYTVATLRSREGEGSLYWRLTAFAETAQAEIMRLGDGDPLSVTGVLTPGIYQPEGAAEARLSLSIVADQAIALKPKKKEPKDGADRPKANRANAAPDDAGPNDPLPW